MWRPPRFVIPALAVFILACGGLLAHAYARQLQAHAQCPTWPECYRAAAAVTDIHDVRDGERVQMLADVGLWLALAGLAGFGWRRRESSFDRRWAIPLAALALVTLAAATRYAYAGPGVSLSQWLTALVVCALLWWLVLRERRFLQPLPATRATRALRPRVLAGLALTLIASALGGWAVAHGIGLPCPDFPACRNEWWPAGNLLAGVALAARPDDETAAAALAVSHRLAALIALLYVGWLGLHLWRTGVRDHLCRYGMLLLAALLVAAGLGIMGAVTRLPPETVMAHSAAAAALILSLVTLYHVLRPVNRPGNPDV
jgi:heme A synthase